MNASSQSGQPMPALEHLDADQLSAFVEGALPEHERLAAVAHLAECPHCRQVAFLMRATEPESEVAATSTAAPRGWRSWFAVAPLFGAAMAGLVVTAVIALAIHYQNSIDRGKTVTTAQVTNPQPFVSTPQTAPPPPRAKTPQPAPRIAASPVVAGGMMAAAAAPAPATPPPAAQHMFAPAAPATAAANDHNASNFATLAANSALKQQRSKSVPTSAAPMAAMQAAAPGSTALSTSESVQVDAAAAAVTTMNAESVQDLPLEARSTRTARTRRKIAQLPSDLAIASSVIAADRTLALDTAGALFLSTDSGAHWTSIHPQWQGTAVAVAVAPSPQSYTFVQPQAPSQSQQRVAAPTYAGASLPSSQMPVPAQQFQLNTSSGAVWTSADGLFWQRR
jgi:hypothetical protein